MNSDERNAVIRQAEDVIALFDPHDSTGAKESSRNIAVAVVNALYPEPVSDSTFDHHASTGHEVKIQYGRVWHGRQPWRVIFASCNNCDWWHQDEQR